MNIESSFKIYSGIYIPTVGTPYIIVAVNQSGKKNIFLERYTIIRSNKGDKTILLHAGTSCYVEDGIPEDVINEESLLCSEFQAAQAQFQDYMIQNHQPIVGSVYSPLMYGFEQENEMLLSKLHILYSQNKILSEIRWLTICNRLKESLSNILRVTRISKKNVALDDDAEMSHFRP
jgi:hypothetical protein